MNNGKFPENVLYYRNGVSKSQYDEVISVELKGIETDFKDCYKKRGGKGDAPKLNITAVIVTKRHSTRFFPR